MTTLVNGRDGAIDPTDRGLAYGDGLFETMAATDGNIRWLDYHLERLAAGCVRLAIPFPDPALLRAEIAQAAAGSGRHVVKIIVTRGAGARGYAPPATAVATRIVGKSSWPAYPPEHYTRGIGLRTLRLTLGENPALAGLKHLCRLEQVLARIELGSAAQEGLLLDRSGFVAGGTMSNVFGVRGGQLLTPALERCGVKGVMRRVVLEAANAAGFSVAERDITLAELAGCDEVFVTNALIGIWPVIDLDGRALPRGPRTGDLMRQLGIDGA